MDDIVEWGTRPQSESDLDTRASAIGRTADAPQTAARDLDQRIALEQVGVDVDARRARELERRYGISSQQYCLMWLQQRGACAICRAQPRRPPLFVDHCHASGQVRGLVCRKCNLAIGLFRDDPLLARGATAYLEAARQRISRIPRPLPP